MNAVLRTSQPEDFEKLLRFYVHFEPKECYRGLPPMTTSEIERWLRQLCHAGDVQFVIDIGVRIVGHAVLHLSPSQTEADLMIFVHQDVRDRGLGKRLLLGTLHYGCKTLCLDRVKMNVHSANPIAQEELEHIGFHATDLNRIFELEYDMERPSHCAECKGERCVIYGKPLPVAIEVPRDNW
jgi:RimJ/RimL family protein N-acetyltransferase